MQKSKKDPQKENKSSSRRAHPTSSTRLPEIGVSNTTEAGPGETRAGNIKLLFAFAAGFLLARPRVILRAKTREETKKGS